MKRFERLVILRRTLIGVLLALAVGMMASPLEAYATTYPLLSVMNGRDKVFTTNSFDLELYLLTDFDDNKYELDIRRDSDNKIVQTASENPVTGINAFGVKENFYLHVNASNWDGGVYKVYSRTYYYSNGSWRESPDNGTIGRLSYTFTYQKSIASKPVVLDRSSFTYNGKVQRPHVKSIDGKSLREGVDYTVAYSNDASKDVGTYELTVTGKGYYSGITSATYTIAKAPVVTKAANTIVAKARTGATVKAGKKLVAKKVVTVRKAKGAVTYAKVSGNKKITVSKKGVVAVKKGLKPGTYKVKIKITAAGDATHKAKAVRVVARIKVK